MDKLPSVIASALVHVISILESYTTCQFQRKHTQNLENVSFFVKCKLPAKDVVNDKDVETARNKESSEKEKLPSALRHSKARLWHFWEKKAAEKAVLPKIPASPHLRGEDSCIDLEKVVLEYLETTVNLVT